MSSKFSVDEDVEKLVKDIIQKNNLQQISDIKYEAGSQVGDGFISKTIAVDVVNEKEPFGMFLKCALNISSTETLPIEKLYSTEIYFYDVVYPAYLKLLEEHGVKDGFRNAPKCYGTSTRNIVALENLKDKGFVLFDKRQMMNESHLILTLKTFAKFHAVSFAFKDQKKEEYDKFVSNTHDFFSNTYSSPGFNTLVKNLINEFVGKLDAENDKHILDKCDGLASKLHDSIISAEKNLNEYSIITQGDCWCNNMMFLYKDEDNTNPIDISLIDWQLLRPASPVFDIAYFFYPIASREALEKLQYYLKVYHEELSNQITQLGSDPKILYPFEVLETEWKQHGKFGFAMSFILIKVMLASKEEALNMEEIDFDNAQNIQKLIPKLKNEDQYIDRLKTLANYMVKYDYL